MKLFETERLFVRQWENGDYLDFYEIASDDKVKKFWGSSSGVDIEKCKNIIERYMKGNSAFAIVQKDSYKVIGTIGMDDISPDESLKEKEQRYIGYSLNSKYWGRGYMPEVVQGFIRYLFEDLNVEIAWSSHVEANHNSKRVLEKCGFKYSFNRDGELFYKINKDK